MTHRLARCGSFLHPQALVKATNATTGPSYTGPYILFIPDMEQQSPPSPSAGLRVRNRDIILCRDQRVYRKVSVSTTPRLYDSEWRQAPTMTSRECARAQSELCWRSGDPPRLSRGGKLELTEALRLSTAAEGIPEGFRSDESVRVAPGGKEATSPGMH